MRKLTLGFVTLVAVGMVVSAHADDSGRAAEKAADALAGLVVVGEGEGLSVAHPAGKRRARLGLVP